MRIQPTTGPDSLQPGSYPSDALPAASSTPGYGSGMQALFVQAPEAVLAERRRLELDGRDEMWDGVLHVVPPASTAHQELGGELFVVLRTLARRAGLRSFYETGLFSGEDDYRIPDQLYCTDDVVQPYGVTGAALVVEIRSPGDETYAKLDFYAGTGVREVLVVHPGQTRVEVFRLVDTRLLPVTADEAGAVRLETLGVRFVPGPPLQLRWDGGSAEL